MVLTRLLWKESQIDEAYSMLGRMREAKRFPYRVASSRLRFMNPKPELAFFAIVFARLKSEVRDILKCL